MIHDLRLPGVREWYAEKGEKRFGVEYAGSVIWLTGEELAALMVVRGKEDYGYSWIDHPELRGDKQLARLGFVRQEIATMCFITGEGENFLRTIEMRGFVYG